MKSDQIVFDIVAKHLLTQNIVSQTASTCAYRGPNDTSCAVGCLISDDEYTDSLEEQVASHVTVMSAVERSLGFTVSEDLLRRLQKIHDCHLVQYWDQELIHVAACYGLDPSVVLEFQKAENERSEAI